MPFYCKRNDSDTFLKRLLPRDERVIRSSLTTTCVSKSFYVCLSIYILMLYKTRQESFSKFDGSTQFIINWFSYLEIYEMVNRDLCQNITSAFVQIIYHFSCQFWAQIERANIIMRFAKRLEPKFKLNLIIGLTVSSRIASNYAHVRSRE